MKNNTKIDECKSRIRVGVDEGATSVMPQIHAANTLAIPSGSELKGEWRRERSGSREVSLFGRCVLFLGRIQRFADPGSTRVANA